MAIWLQLLLVGAFWLALLSWEMGDLPCSDPFCLLYFFPWVFFKTMDLRWEPLKYTSCRCLAASSLWSFWFLCCLCCFSNRYLRSLVWDVAHNKLALLVSTLVILSFNFTYVLNYTFSQELSRPLSRPSFAERLPQLQWPRLQLVYEHIKDNE